MPSPGPYGSLHAIVKGLRFQRDALKNQPHAVGTLTVGYVVVSLGLGLNAAKGHLAPLGVVFGAFALGIAAAVWGGFEEGELWSIAMGLAFPLMLAWITVLVILLIHDLAAVGYCYLLPAIVLLVLVWMLPSRFPLRDEYDVALMLQGYVRSAPLLGPVLLGLFAIALFNADLWRAAGELAVWRIAVVAALTLGPLMLVVRAQLRGRLGHVLEEQSANLPDAEGKKSRLRKEISLAVPGAPREAIQRCANAVVDHWPSKNLVKEYVPEVKQLEGKTLLAPVTVRLLVTVLLVGLIILAFMYLLTWVAVPTNVAEAWSKHQSVIAHVHVVVRISYPLYFRVSVLLSVVATAAFLGAAALDERVWQPLTDAILGEPVKRLLVLALPYRSLVQEAPKPAGTGV